jgi:hypothetical protein
MRRPIALTAAAAALAGSAALGASTSASGVATPTLKLKTVGYIYAGTISSGIETLAVRSDYTLRLVHTTPSPGGASPGGDIGGVTLVHTKSGIKLYVLAGRPGYEGAIYTYSVSSTTGALTKSTVKPPAGGAFAVQAGNNLFSWDGRAHSPGDADAIYAQSCAGSECAAFSYGFGVYKVSQSTGALTLAGTPNPANIFYMSGVGDRIDLLESNSSGRAVVPITVDHPSGLVTTGAAGYIETNDNPPQPAGASTIATGSGTVAVGAPFLGGTTTVPQIAVYSGVKANVLHGVSTDALVTPSVMMFLPHVLLVGGTNGTGPKLQLITPDGALTEGTIDLTNAPYNLNSGSGTDPFAVETIFTLGHGLYLGNYLNPIVQGTWGVGGKNLALNQTHPIVANTGNVTSMAGFLLPAATKTTIALHRQGTKLIVSGGVSGGQAGVHVTVAVLVKKGTHYVPNSKKGPALTSKHRYSATFTSPNAARCETTARYPGTATTKASGATLRFAC